MKNGKVLILIVLILLIIVGCSLIRTFFYPPVVTAGEVYEKQGESLSFSIWNDDLQKYVKNGFVDYSKWKQNQQNFAPTLEIFNTIKSNNVARDHLLAAYINAYNVFTVQLIFEYLPDLKSINDIPKAKRWDAVRWQMGKNTVSLNQLEHDIIRKKFIEPRIHFAIVCASIGCPHLSDRAYEGDTLEEQLTTAAQDFFRRSENCKIDGKKIYLSSIFNWFRGDFVRDELASELGWFGEEYKSASKNVRLLMFIAKFAPEEISKQISADYKKWSISYTKYDWNLNGK